MRCIESRILPVVLLLCLAPRARAQEDGPAQDTERPGFSETIEGLERRAGFVSMYVDHEKGRLLFELPPPGRDLLYVVSLPAGVGSNDIGLDRGKLGATRVVRFERSGPRVLLVARNLGFRATTRDPAERRAVDESFAESVLYGFDVLAEEGERALVDATSFVLRDAFGVERDLRRAQQGEFSLDPGRCALHLASTRAFPRNTEVEVTLTFAGKEPVRFVRDVVPDARSVSVRQRHSFVALPEDGYEPLPFEPGCGYISVRFADYAAPIDAPLERRLACRHRIERRADGTVEPLVYHVDPGAPEPVRSALLDGARWWAEAFAVAGHPRGFRVELLPEGADPMDVRYNVVQWVHCATRGWSYGSSVVDPRTGEILKGHVTLGSLRVRQDFRIAEALLCPYGGPDAEEGRRRAREMALARIRQLAAHEVGHTLGLVHNFAASVSGRASVMDYPHPLVRLDGNGEIDLEDAYDTGIGEWDRVVIRFGYDDRLNASGRERVLVEAREGGLPYVTDADARPPGGAHPEAHLWDNGTDAVAELDRVLRIRREVLRNLATGCAIPDDVPAATLEEALVPAYLLHRYQTEAAAKVLGGVRYGYGSGESSHPRVVAPERQRAALSALLRTLEARELTLPEELLRRLPPRPPGYPHHRELFRRRTGVTFDPLAAAEAAAQLVLGLLLHPERAARLVEHHARDPRQPSLDDVLETLVARTLGREPGGEGLAREVARVVDQVVLAALLDLAEDRAAPAAVRGHALAVIGRLEREIAGRAPSGDPGEQAHRALALERIRRYRLDPEDRPAVPVLAAPPGSPIGCGSQTGAP